MTWYRVLLHGTNFKMKLSDNQKICGFYTTRYVQAETAEEAEILAVDLVRKDKYLTKRVKNKPDDSPMIYLDEIESVDFCPSVEEFTGYSFYSN